MKLIIAYVQPHRLDAIRRALERVPHFPGISVSEVRGFGREKVLTPPQTAEEALTDYTKHSRLEIFAHDADVPAIVEALRSTAHTGRRGDGKVFVLGIESALRILSGEVDEAAI